MKRLLFLLPLIACLSGCKAETRDPLRLDHSVKPLSQQIALSLDPDRDTYSGSVDIQIEVTQKINKFCFHARDLDIGNVRIKSASVDQIMTFSEGEKGTVTAKTPAALEPGNYALHISFTNDFSRQGTGVYKVEYEGRNYLYTQMEPEYARDSFPCWDAPEFKIPWQLRLTVPTNVTAYANTPVQSQKVVDDFNDIVFEPTKPMPSYLIALAIGHFESIPVTNLSVPGRIVVPEGKLNLTAEAARISPALLRELENYFEIPYPYRKLDQIAVPEFNFGAMENVGLITYRDTALLRDPKSITLGQQQGLSSIVAHEMSHMWFGNLVTPKWWDDLWLNESFASWIALKMVNRVSPEYEMANKDIESRQRAMSSDSLPTTKPIRRPVAAADAMTHLFDSLAYNKGMAILDMIENWMGEEPFRRGMVKYMSDHAWGNTDAFDLAASLSTVVDSDVLAIMKCFVNQAGIPFLEIEPLSESEVRITQKRYSQYGVELDDNPKWVVPVVLKYGNIDTRHTQKVLLTKHAQTVTLGHPAEWLYPNADEKGYFRWKLPAEEMKELSAKVHALNIRNRIGFISNTEALFYAGQLETHHYLEIMASFSLDSSPEVRQSVVHKLSGFAPEFIPTELKEPYGLFLSSVLKPMLDKIGTDKQNGEDILIEKLRPALINSLGWNCEDPDIRQLATDRAQAYMADPYSVDPSLAQALLRLSAKNGDTALFDTYAEKYEASPDPNRKARYLKALSGFRDPVLMKRALDYALSDAVPPHQFGSIPFSIAQNDRDRRLVLDWLRENYPAIQQKIPEQSLAYLPWLACGQSPELLEEARIFLLSGDQKNQGMEIEFAKAEAVMKLKIRLQTKELENIRRFLNRY